MMGPAVAVSGPTRPRRSGVDPLNQGAHVINARAGAPLSNRKSQFLRPLPRGAPISMSDCDGNFWVNGQPIEWRDTQIEV
jgi:hypothetical protein